MVASVVGFHGREEGTELSHKGTRWPAPSVLGLLTGPSNGAVPKAPGKQVVISWPLNALSGTDSSLDDSGGQQ